MSTTSVGIDLAAQPERTAACVIEWPQQTPAQVVELASFMDDHKLLQRMTAPNVARVGIDAPFGWPLEFIEAITRYRDTGRWPDVPGEEGKQQQMRLRATDWSVKAKAGLAPLSVSSDKIAVVAMRCSRLLSAYWQRTEQTPDRSGRGIAVEVYPAAALRRWKLSQHDHPQDPGTYKGSSAGALRRRGRIVRRILTSGSGWLTITPETVKRLISSDHLLDALVCALIARAVALDQVLPIPSGSHAAEEGWIALPSMPLAGLGGRSADVNREPPIAELLMPLGGYVEVYMPPRFSLEIQDHVGGGWSVWATGLRPEWFLRNEDGSYVCTDHGGSPIRFRALSIDDRGVFEHVDGDGYGHVYRYRLRPDPDAV